MPNVKDPHRQHHGRKLQTPKVHLATTQLAHQPLRRLGEPETRPEIDQQRGGHERKRKRHHRRRRHFPRAPQKHGQQDQKHEEGENLKGQPGEKDIIRRRRILALTLRAPDHRGASDLDDGSDDVANDEDPEDGLGPQKRRIGAADGIDHHAEDRVDGRAEEDGRDDDEEVLDDEIDDVVGRFARGQGARDVADDFEDAADGQRQEVPCSVPRRLDGVQERADGEEGGAEDGEGEGWGVAVYDDRGVVFAAGVGEVRVYVEVAGHCGA